MTATRTPGAWLRLLAAFMVAPLVTAFGMWLFSTWYLCHGASNGWLCLALGSAMGAMGALAMVIAYAVSFTLGLLVVAIALRKNYAALAHFYVGGAAFGALAAGLWTMSADLALAAFTALFWTLWALCIWVFGVWHNPGFLAPPRAQTRLARWTAVPVTAVLVGLVVAGTMPPPPRPTADAPAQPGPAREAKGKVNHHSLFDANYQLAVTNRSSSVVRVESLVTIECNGPNSKTAPPLTLEIAPGATRNIFYGCRALKGWKLHLGDLPGGRLYAGAPCLALNNHLTAVLKADGEWDLEAMSEADPDGQEVIEKLDAAHCEVR